MIKRSDYFCQIIAAHRDVAVGKNDDIMTNMRPQSDQRGHFGIRATHELRDLELDIAMRPIDDHPLDNRDGRIAWILHAEEKLHSTGIILIAK